MTQQIINIGTTPNDRSGDSLRIAFAKINANFNELYTSGFLSNSTGELVFPNGQTQAGAAIPLSELKIIVAASTSFEDFQTRIAAL